MFHLDHRVPTYADLSEVHAFLRDCGAETTVEMGCHPATYGTEYYGVHRDALRNIADSDSFDAPFWDVEDIMIAAIDAGRELDEMMEMGLLDDDCDPDLDGFDDPDIYDIDDAYILEEIYSADPDVAWIGDGGYGHHPLPDEEPDRRPLVRPSHGSVERLSSHMAAIIEEGWDAFDRYTDSMSWKDSNRRARYQFLRHVRRRVFFS